MLRSRGSDTQTSHKQHKGSLWDGTLIPPPVAVGGSPFWTICWSHTYNHPADRLTLEPLECLRRVNRPGNADVLEEDVHTQP